MPANLLAGKGIIIYSFILLYRRHAMNIVVVIEPSEEGGYTVTVPSLPGCISEGDTREQALINIREAIALYLEPVDDDVSFSPEAEQLEIAI
jgi:predicted RNase H-like HicB family nuclease